MIESLQWVAFVYLLVALFKILISTPFLFKLPIYYRDVIKEKLSLGQSMSMIVICSLIVGLTWPVLLLIEGKKFFWADSAGKNRELFTKVFEDLKKQQKTL